MANFVIPKLELWLAEGPAGELVGMLALEGEWIDQLYVDPDLTGQRIGTQLLQIAKREHPDRLRLWTFVSNTRAQRFYERHGFTEVERTDGGGNEEGAPDIQYTWAPASSEESRATGAGPRARWRRGVGRSSRSPVRLVRVT